MIDLGNAIIKKEIPENENPNKLVDIVENILDFNKQQKGNERPLDCSKLGIRSLTVHELKY